MSATSGVMVYLQVPATGEGVMAWFNEATLPVTGDFIVLDHGRRRDRPTIIPDGEYEVVRRRISAVGENVQRVDYYLRRASDVPTDYGTI